MGAVDDYTNLFTGEKKEWLVTFVNFMRKNYPAIQEGFSYQMPMYKFRGNYIAFSVAKDHFTFHTLDFNKIEELKTSLMGAKFGKGCAKIPFGRRENIPLLFEAIKKIVEKSEATKPE